jgi:arylsulfatase
LILAGLAACGSREDPPPNVLVLCIDTLRGDRLGYQGYQRDTSPVIDALAARGARFREAYSTYPQTAPAVASLFSGLHPSAHEKTSAAGSRLAPELELMAETFRRAGYRTGMVTTNPMLAPGLGYEQGFEECTWVRGLRSQAEADASLAGAEVAPGTHTTVRHGKASYYGRGDAASEAALEWLDGLGGSGEPFFLYLHYMDVHSPYSAPAPHDEMFVEAPGRDRYCNGVPNDSVSSEDLAYMQALYDGGIRYTDSMVGELLRGLDERGLLTRTLVALVADHGEEFLEHGGLGHGQTLHRELLRVPLLLAGPGIAPHDVTATVSLVDVYPTLCQLTGTPVPADLQGQSLVPLLGAGGTPTARVAFAECGGTRLSLARGSRGRRARNTDAALASLGVRAGPRLEPGFSVVDGEWHLIHGTTTGVTELYRHREDPAETTNLAAAQPAEVERLLALGRAQREQSGQLGRAIEASSIEIDAATRAELEALGYAGDER